MIIYTIKNIINDKYYIGQTILSLSKRKNGHCSRLRNNNHWNIYLQRSWNRHGEKNFIFFVTERCDSIEELNEREKHWIEKCGDYNLTTGGKNYIHSEQSIKKLNKEVFKYSLDGKLIEGYNSIKGASHDTNIYYNNICGCANGKRKTAGGFRWSFDKKDKLKNIDFQSTKEKQVIQYNLNGDQIDEFNSLAEAARKTNSCRSSISKYCRGIYEHHNNYKWKYKT